MSTKQVTLRMPEELLDRIEILCEQVGMSRTSAINMILTSGISLIERLAFPEQYLNDPVAVKALQDIVERKHEELQKETSGED